jgi:hypothetical protein
MADEEVPAADDQHVEPGSAAPNQELALNASGTTPRAIEESAKGWYGAFKDRYADYLYPRLEPQSEAQKLKDDARIKAEKTDLETRLAHLDNEALRTIQIEFKALLTVEAGRRASVDSRLSTVMGLTSVVAAITFGTLTFRAGAGFQYPHSWAVWLAIFITLYIVIQLTCAIRAALSGTGVRNSIAVNYRDAVPQVKEGTDTHSRRLISRYLDCLHDQQQHNNSRISQLLVAHFALRNFLWGVATLTIVIIAATLIPANREKDIVKELRAEPSLYDALRGPKGEPGRRGEPGKDGKDGKDAGKVGTSSP